MTSPGKSMFALVCALVSGIANAELVVIYDSGHSSPMNEFLGPVLKSRPRSDGLVPPSASRGAAKPQNLLPIRSPGLSPGDIVSRDHTLPFVQAFFLIGSDARSMRWLEKHRAQLLQLDAVGLLVQAESLEELEAVAAIAKGLSISPASGSDIAKALGVSHYPLAISDGRIWQ